MSCLGALNPWPTSLGEPPKLGGQAMARDLTTDTAAVREIFHSWEAMEGLPSVGVQPAAPAARFPGEALVAATYPGVLAAATIALASTWLSDHYGAPVMLFALLFGMAFHFLHEEGRCVAGIEFSSKAVLRTGVALLGAKITAAQILSLGVMPIATVIVAVASTIALGAAAARRVGQTRAFGVLP